MPSGAPEQAHPLILGLLGRPVAHSLSPLVIAELARRSKVSARYELIDTDAAGLPAVLKRVRSEGWAGFNVTYPLKEAVAGQLDAFDERAAALLAVNVVRREGSLWKGYNTDMDGFRLALASVGTDLKGRRVVVWGSGGAARAAVLASARAGAQWVTVFSRDPARARPLIDGLLSRAPGARLNVQRTGEPPPEDADVWVNATTVGMPGVPVPSAVWDLPSRPRGVACDFVYGGGETPFLACCRSAGLACVPGTMVLVGQALRAWELWTHRPLHDVETQLREIAALVAGEAPRGDA